MSRSAIIHNVESCIPEKILSFYRKSKRFLIWKIQNCVYKKEVKRLSGTLEPIQVWFLVLYPSVWKYDSLYRLMEKDVRFSPHIMVCPVVDGHDNRMIETMNKCYDYFISKGYDVIKAFDENLSKYVEVNSLKPDILFYASQWDGHYDKRYRSSSLFKYLKCYVNYSYKNNPYEWSIASQFQGKMWMYFSECEDNKELALSFNPREFKNIHVVGYPMYDEIQETTALGKEWKIKDKKLKRIIWAPHHSIEGHDGLIKLSTFLSYYKTMQQLAQKYKTTVQFVFKPHPQLRSVLYQHPDWGKERTDEYYDFWENSENTSYVNGAYVDLFKSSDAMIHDCHSFTVEYLYVNKPVMFLANYDRPGQSNKVGMKAFNAHYHGMNEEDIENFIKNVVIDSNDTMKSIRNEFYQSVLVPPYGKTVAENILYEITKVLKI